jgi:hypothetical protein
MTCTPSQQVLRIEAQFVAPDGDDPFLGSALRMAMDPRQRDWYAMHRHDPAGERDARRSLIDRLSTTLDGNDLLDLSANNAAELLSPSDDITVDDFLAAHELALAEKRIAGFRPFGEFLLVELLDGRVIAQRTNLILEAPIEPLLICLDHTQYWQEGPEVTEAGRIYTTYLTDASTGIHMCELEPSFDLRHLYSTPEHDNEERSISEWVSENDDPTDTSMHVRFIDRLPESKKLYRERTYMEADDTYEQTMERLVNDLRANVALQTPDRSRERNTSPGL